MLELTSTQATVIAAIFLCPSFIGRTHVLAVSNTSIEFVNTKWRCCKKQYYSHLMPNDAVLSLTFLDRCIAIRCDIFVIAYIYIFIYIYVIFLNNISNGLYTSVVNSKQMHFTISFRPNNKSPLLT